MKNAIAGHHHPDRPGIGFLASVVHVADGISHMLSRNAGAQDQTISVSVVSWNGLNLDQASLDTLIEEATLRFKKLDQVEL